jgi:hypothetical protein
MIVSSIVRWGGIAGVAAAALLVLSAILNQLSPLKTTYDSATDYLYLVAVFAAYVAVLVALLGIHAVHRGMPRYGRLGAIGTVMSFAGYAIIATVTAINMVQGQRSLQIVRIGGALALLIGSVLLGVVILRAKLLPWWCGVLLIVAFPLGDRANAIFSSAEYLLLALLWGSVGIALLVQREKVPEPAVTEPA